MNHIAKKIQGSQSFLVTTHYQPDGDGIGSAMALHLYLVKQGKESHIILPSEVPEKFSVIDPRSRIQICDSKKPLPKVDTVFVMDTNELKMLGPMQVLVESLGAKVIFVDHHVSDLKDLEEHLIDESFGSTGELVHTFLKHLRADIDHEIAVAIYVAIITDTGNFRYKRTSHRTHEIVAELLQRGVLPENIYQRVYAHDSVSKMKFLGHVLQTMEASPDQKIVWVQVTKSEREKFNATVEDTESYVNQLTFLKGIEIAILFREDAEGVIKVSLRGIGETPVIGIAKKFGGGGHRHAAGAKIKGNLKDVMKHVVAEARKSISA